MSKRNATNHLFDSTVNRRGFLKTSAATLASLYGLNHLSPSLAQAAGEVKFLTWAHFVPTSDEELKKQAAAFAKEKGTKVSVELIAHLQLSAKKASEAHAKSGHDLVMFFTGDPELFNNLLLDVSDIAESLGKTNGGWYDYAKDLCIKDGKWKAIPWMNIAFPLVVRVDLLKDVGATKIETYDDLLKIGKKLKDKGHPIGFQIGHCFDSIAICNLILWSHGGRITAEDSKTITINSSETARALEYMKKLYVDTMDPEVLSWDDASNNRFLLSGKGSIIYNPISAYWIAKTKKIMVEDKPLVDLLDHFLPPEGPSGRFAVSYPWVLGIWNFAGNTAGAKEFIKYHFAPENYNNWLKAGDGYNMPLLKDFEKNPVWDSDPKYKFAREINKYTKTQGWPGKPTEYSQIAEDLYIIPDMFAAVASGNKSVPDAIKRAEHELKLIYAGQKKAEAKKD